jgi:hypothetical protein
MQKIKYYPQGTKKYSQIKIKNNGSITIYVGKNNKITVL